jgi:hypothetical protein
MHSNQERFDENWHSNTSQQDVTAWSCVLESLEACCEKLAERGMLPENGKS